MIHTDDIASLTDFKRATLEHIRRLKKSGRASVLTVNGRAAVVVQDAAAFQKLLDRLDRAEAIAGIRRGLAEFERAEGLPARDALLAARRDRRRRRRNPA